MRLINVENQQTKSKSKSPRKKILVKPKNFKELNDNRKEFKDNKEVI